MKVRKVESVVAFYDSVSDRVLEPEPVSPTPALV
jgi:hypothetical protein